MIVLGLILFTYLKKAFKKALNYRLIVRTETPLKDELINTFVPSIF